MTGFPPLLPAGAEALFYCLKPVCRQAEKQSIHKNVLIGLACFFADE
jgi:hypothetical protein